MAHRLVAFMLGAATIASACVSLSTPADTATPTVVGGTVASASFPSTPVVTATPQPTATPAASLPPPTASQLPSPTASATVTGRIVNTEYGYAVTLPDGWIALTGNSDFGELIKQSLRFDPRVNALCQSEDPSEIERCLDEQVAELQSQFDAFDQAGAVLAFDLGSVFETVPKVAVVLRTPGLGVTTDVLLAVGERSLRDQGARGRIQSDAIDLPAGQAVRFIWNTPPDMGRRGIAYQYHLISGEYVYTLVVVGRKGADGLAEVADLIGRSLEILPAQ